MNIASIIAERKHEPDLRRELGLGPNDTLSFREMPAAESGYGWFYAHMGEPWVYLGQTHKAAAANWFTRVRAARKLPEVRTCHACGVDLVFVVDVWFCCNPACHVDSNPKHTA